MNEQTQDSFYFIKRFKAHKEILGNILIKKPCHINYVKG